MNQLSLFEPAEPDDAVPVWAALDEEQRAEVVATLARVMTKMVATPTDNKEKANE